MNKIATIFAELCQGDRRLKVLPILTQQRKHTTGEVYREGDKVQGAESEGMLPRSCPFHLNCEVVDHRGSLGLGADTNRPWN